MKRIRKLVSVIVALAMVAMPALVAEVVKAATPVSVTGDPTSLVITREVEGVTNPVVNTFTYQVIAADTNPAIATNLPANFTIAFDGSEPIVDNVATKTTTLDMSSIIFPEVGDYEFIVKEIGSSNDTIYKIDRTEWYSYVSVRYITEDGTVGGTPTANMEAKLAPLAKAGNTGAKKDIVFNASAEFTNISLRKSVTGNLADINEYFKYTFTFPNGDVADNTKYIVLGAHSTDGSTTVTESELTIVGNTASLYLKHGQNVTIGLTAASNGLQQIPVGLEYEITEAAPGYKIYIDGSTSETPSSKIEKTTTSDAADNATSYINNKEAEPITGFFVNYWPFMLLIVLGIIGAVVFRKTSKKANK